MKAARLHQRGGPEQVVVEDAPLPAPATGEIRVKVQAAALTPTELTWDETYRHPDGTPRLPTIPGHDVSGTIDALGPAVTGCTTGDPVYGLIDFPFNGSTAEYAIIPAKDAAPAPRTLDPVTAAAVPLSALTAWQALFDHGKLQAGQRVLIHGAAGGVGGFALQMAKEKNAHVIATASPRNADMVRRLGAHEVIDYATTPFDDVLSNLDLVFNLVGGESLDRSFKTLRPGGTLVSITKPPDQKLAAQAGVSAVFFIVRPNRTQLIAIAEAIDANRLKVNVEAVYPLAQARAAFQRALAGHLTGKVVLRINPPT